MWMGRGVGGEEFCFDKHQTLGPVSSAGVRLRPPSHASDIPHVIDVVLGGMELLMSWKRIVVVVRRR